MNLPDERRPDATPDGDEADTPIASLWRRWRDDPSPHGAGLSPDRALAVLRYDQLQRWHGGERVLAEQYLDAWTVLNTDAEQGLVLVYGEYLLRQELGEGPALDEYVRRFPQYAERLREQDAFHQALTAHSLPATAVAESASPARAGHCHIIGEIARGGMGVVLHGRDERLDRELAVKILRDEHAGRPDVVRRFLDEARVCGRLQHPGIVPIHDVGEVADGRPYFTMKLVQGRTLAALLADRPNPAADLPRFLKVFEQVCQTVAYAHARGVVHRDLKPANVMVGEFGEVQVMDWGLAKVLSPESKVLSEAVTSQDSGLRTQDSGLTEAGSVVGTPAYMPPEQARGEAVDWRCDVFGLGAILCEILTGRPPYTDATKDALLARAARGDLADALVRIDGCLADADLRHLATACLAADPARRPRDAGAVAASVATYQASVQERLRAAEIEGAAARARAVAERRARRLTVGLAVSVLGLALAGGISWWLLERKAAEAVRGVEGALQAAERLQAEERWVEALAVVPSEAALSSSIPAGLRRRVAERLTDLKMVVNLDENRLLMFDYPDKAARDCATAFREYGIDATALEPAVAAEDIRGRGIRDQLVAAVDDWSFAERDHGLKQRLVAVAQAADPDSWRDAVRTAILKRDASALKKLAEADMTGQPVRALVLLGKGLERLLVGHRDPTALNVLRAAQRQYPSDVWANYLLAGALDDQRPPKLGEAIRFYTAVVALRPKSASARMNLGYALKRNGALDEAIAAYEESLRLKPDFALARMNLGNALQAQGKVDQAIDEFRESIRLDATDPLVHYNLGNALYIKDQLDAAIAAHRAALRLNKNFSQAHTNLGMALADVGEIEESVAAYREALRIAKDDILAWNNLGRTYQQLGKLDDAVAAFREAIRIKDDYAMAHCNLGLALQRQGRLTEALDSLKRGHDLGKKDPRWNRPSAVWIKICERQIELDRRLPAMLAGDEVADAERDEFAVLCTIRGLPAAAARLHAAIFAAHPDRGEDATTGRRYSAATQAALAGCGRGRDDPPPDEPTRAAWRARAVEWLRADLGLWAEHLAREPARAGPAVRKALRHWQLDPDLAGLRDAAELARLSDAERESCQQLWADVETLRAKAAGAK